MNPGWLAKTGARVRRELWEPPADQFPGLNGLRALATYLVILYHVGIFGGQFPLFAAATPELSATHRLVNGFWIGINIFFVLSGFLIGRILMKSYQRSGSLEFRTFFVRRSFRIFPAYYLVLTFGLFVFARLPAPIPWYLLGGAEWSEAFANGWQNYSYTVNYFFSAGDANVMSWAWSLCVEEQFYLALPLILLFVFRFEGKGVRPAILFVGVLIPPIMRTLHYLADPNLALLDGVYYRTHNRADELFYGVLVAYYYVFHHDAFKARVERWGSLTWVIGLLCILVVWTFGGIQVRGAFAVIAQFTIMAVGSALLITNCLFLENGFTRFMAHRSWFPAARVSYGTYLIHPYVLFVLLSLMGTPSNDGFGGLWIAGLLVSVIVVSNLISACMYMLYESHMIEFGRKLGRRWAQPAR